VSPIFVRPVREQLEHDRLIRFLTARYKRKFEVAANVGDERLSAVKVGTGAMYPDLLLTSGRKLAGLVEVETGESVNNLEAMAQWTHFSRLRVPFSLYVPVPAYDAARRLCEANQARVAEIWTYRATMDGFDLVRLHHDPAAAAGRPEPKTGKARGAKQPSRSGRPPARTPAKSRTTRAKAPAKAKTKTKAASKGAKPGARGRKSGGRKR
jgi:hypothetical protein